MRSRPEYTLHDLLHNSVARDPSREAVVDGDARYTYEDLRETTDDLTNWSMSFGDGEAGFWLR